MTHSHEPEPRSITKGRVSLAICAGCYLGAAALKYMDIPGDTMAGLLCVFGLAVLWAPWALRKLANWLTAS